MKYSAVFAAVFVGYVAAQSGTVSPQPPIPTASISPCVLDCISQSATSAGCSSISDVSCICTSTDFLTAATECLTSKCSIEQQQEALGLQSQLCDASSGTGSATPTPTPTRSATSSASTATAPASSSAASVTSRATGSSASSASSVTRASSVAGSASSVIASVSSAAASATGSGNGATALPAFNFAATGVWAVVALGGAAAAQLVL